jgi:hypothetical protein
MGCEINIPKGIKQKESKQSTANIRGNNEERKEGRQYR